MDKCTLIHFDPHFFIGLAGCLVTFHLRGGPQFSTGATFHIYIYIYIFDRNFSNILNLGKKWALVYFLYIENLKIEYKLQTIFLLKLWFKWPNYFVLVLPCPFSLSLFAQILTFIFYVQFCKTSHFLTLSKY